MTAPVRTTPARRAGRGWQPPDLGRRHLRLVGDAPNRRRRRARLRMVVAAVALITCGSLFGMAAFHALLVAGQTRLDRLEEQVADEQGRYQRLRLEVAELESPARIVAAAQERLGMVPPPDVTYLSPSGAVAEELAAEERAAGERTGPDVSAGDPDGAGTSAHGRQGGGTSGGSPRAWATVKPYLGGRR